ncbi:MAG: hypothetical protein R3330_18295, partial [Saprospiraceae bacterium]|nr:hypothetical protein [Saprospiraceae bacterium]
MRPVHWGPPESSGYDAGVSDYVMREILQAAPGAKLEFRFAPENKQTLGRFTPEVPQGQTVYNGEIVSTGTISGEVGPTSVNLGNVQPHTQLAGNFVNGNWNVRGIGGYRAGNVYKSSTPSEHSKGLAIDVHVAPAGTKASGEDLALGNAIALWFASNPDVFHTTKIIWYDKRNSGDGWSDYVHPANILSNNTLQHRDHVHIEFAAGSYPQPGTQGTNSWVGANATEMVARFGGPVGAGPGGNWQYGGYQSVLLGPTGLPLINAWQWTPQVNQISESFAGARALMNDVPLLDSIGGLTNASMRSWMAAPNGDFL